MDIWRSSWATPLLQARPHTASCSELSLSGSEYLKGCSSRPYFISFSVKISWEKPAKALLKESLVYNIYYTLLVYQATQFITDIYQAGQAWYPPWEICANTDGSCALCTRKWLPRNTAPPPSKEACRCLAPPFRYPLAPLLTIKIIKRLPRVASQWHRPFLSALVGASHQDP